MIILFLIDCFIYNNILSMPVPIYIWQFFQAECRKVKAETQFQSESCLIVVTGWQSLEISFFTT